MATLTVEMLVVFALVVVTVVFFMTEVIPPDTTAIAVAVALVVLGDWTQISPTEAVSGFSSSATITILAMYILSAGVEDTGIVERLGVELVEATEGSQPALLGAIVGFTGLLAGIVNNTPVVAVLTPMVTDVADRVHVSPSKLLIPLSYAAMLGGTLTLVGTATNVVASDLAAGLSGQYPELREYAMFEFTVLGVIVTVVGTVYLLTVGQRLLPERIPVVDLIGEFGLSMWLSRVYVGRDSPVVGQTVEEALAGRELDLDVIQIVRGDESYVAPETGREIRAGDVLTVRARPEVVTRFIREATLRSLPKATVTEEELADPQGRGTLVEVVVPLESSLVGRTVADTHLRDRYADTVLAVRRGQEVFHEGIPGFELAAGDGLLLHTTRETVDLIHESDELSVSEESRLLGGEDTPPLSPNTGLAVGIVLGVVMVAAMTSIPISIAALGGVVAMVVTDVLNPTEAYDAVGWEVIFLLAGVFPLGVAMQQTGAAAFLAEAIVSVAGVLPPVAVLASFYLLTGLLANVITPVASVILVFPVAIDAAARIGADPFAFALAVTFAGSTAFMTPVGYQTNLMVYSPGGYRFTDFLRVGAPLQLLLTVVTPLAIDAIWTV
jgi:di/tricarboxylate transporter